MINKFIGFFSSQRRLLNPWELPLTGLLLTIVGLTTSTSSLATVVSQQQEEASRAAASAMPKAIRSTTTAQAPASDASIPDGTYLYGQSSQPDQIGQEYIVFEARQGKVIGAVYLPSSEFSCFYGTVDSKYMNLMVVNSYDQTAFAHTIAREQPSPIAAAGGHINIENTYDSLAYPYTLGLEGYQLVSQISDNDRQILSVCMNTHKDKTWN